IGRMPRSLPEAEAAFDRDPRDTDAFTNLLRAYKKSKDFHKLASLWERRAVALEDPSAQAELYWEAAQVRLSRLKDPAGGELLLRRALDKHPAHPRATERMKELLQAQTRTTDYADVLERQIEGLATSRHDPKQLASLHHELGALYDEHFARLDRAMEHY